MLNITYVDLYIFIIKHLMKNWHKVLKFIFGPAAIPQIQDLPLYACFK